MVTTALQRGGARRCDVVCVTRGGGVVLGPVTVTTPSWSRASPTTSWTTLGPGADHFTGGPAGEVVFDYDSDPDVIETGRGFDQVASGAGRRPGEARRRRRHSCPGRWATGVARARCSTAGARHVSDGARPASPRRQGVRTRRRRQVRRADGGRLARFRWTRFGAWRWASASRTFRGSPLADRVVGRASTRPTWRRQRHVPLESGFPGGRPLPAFDAGPGRDRALVSSGVPATPRPRRRRPRRRRDDGAARRAHRGRRGPRRDQPGAGTVHGTAARPDHRARLPGPCSPARVNDVSGELTRNYGNQCGPGETAGRCSAATGDDTRSGTGRDWFGGGPGDDVSSARRRSTRCSAVTVATPPPVAPAATAAGPRCGGAASAEVVRTRRDRRRGTLTTCGRGWRCCAPRGCWRSAPAAPPTPTRPAVTRPRARR